MDTIEKMMTLIAGFDSMEPAQRNRAFLEMEEAIDRMSYDEKVAIQPQTTQLMEQLLQKARGIVGGLQSNNSKAA